MSSVLCIVFCTMYTITDSYFGSQCYKIFGQKFSLYRELKLIFPRALVRYRENLSPKTL